MLTSSCFKVVLKGGVVCTLARALLLPSIFATVVVLLVETLVESLNDLIAGLIVVVPSSLVFDPSYLLMIK